MERGREREREGERSMERSRRGRRPRAVAGGVAEAGFFSALYILASRRGHAREIR
jgi:hypothetical protein